MAEAFGYCFGGVVTDSEIGAAQEIKKQLMTPALNRQGCALPTEIIHIAINYRYRNIIG